MITPFLPTGSAANNEGNNEGNIINNNIIINNNKKMKTKQHPCQKLTPTKARG